MVRGKLNKSKAALRAMVIKSLAHPSRVLLVDALGGGEMCVCDLTEVVGSDISTVSKHLAVLKSAGLVSVEKRGLNQFYRLNCLCLADFFRCVDSINQQQSRTLQKACIG
ncbi:MAG: metalloregulator ArsR/SmtB family transcription factor [Terrimicrobiaceae bacterium]